MTTKCKHTVLSIEDKPIICERLDKGSSKRPTHEYDISKLTVLELFLLLFLFISCTFDYSDFLII